MAGRKSNKIKILLVLVFAVMLTGFVVWLVRFYNETRNNISEGIERIDCIDYEFELMNINYDGSILFFEVVNEGSSGNPIRSISIEYDNKTNIRKFDEPILASGSSVVRFEDVDLEESFFAYANDCSNVKKEFVLI